MSRRGYADSAYADASIARADARRSAKERDEARAALAARNAEIERLLTLAYREGWAHRDLGRSPDSNAAVAAILAGGAQ